ncbi:MAG TPA: ferrous iron transport protein B [Pyrinomonadaceae bacterium]|nr:ferrous iron transport protein B [Chloracidobacterium sp.]MBP9936785.1 ferrous iron transport protein B [Pyrinomonadaceae bacterium]MBK7802722.1 ferrous iron transport protein B [Chloracidobacterium sp.]MBK9767149.1 ferrous iron transport protein B [Chloracidobacterium sp.]MBL0240242.1 ferrous iron transport protein B [Chloracidobacterium sp.]
MNQSVHTSTLTIALAGNPNAGKTTLFNALTGLKQKIANYPGVTVERKEGPWSVGGAAANLIDLPGLYSLDATSLDEQIAREIITGELPSVPKPDVIVAVVDATNLERNLYLVTQLFEFGVPVVVALTMIDVFEKQQHEIDVEMLSALLKVPVVSVNAKSHRGIDELAEKVASVIGTVPDVPYEITANTDEDGSHGKIFARYNFISNAVQESTWHSDQKSHRVSDKIDRVLTHRFFGLIILVAILLVVFQTIFSWASLPMDLLEKGFGAFGDFVRAEMPPGILADLVADGIVAGVGGVVVFLPQILLLFLFISLLEDSGYMSRAAFLLDKLMSRVGLHGKAFLPLISSFACAIPGIMATRTIESRRDRFATIMIAPFMSCSARLPVYTLMIGAFFGGQYVFGFVSIGALLMLIMYSIGIIAAIATGFVLKRTLLKAPPPPFLMELPPYRLPNLRTVFQNMVTRAWLFLKRAGTVILAISIILWALMYFPRNGPAPIPTGGNVSVKVQTDSTGGEVAADTPLSESEQLKHSYAGKLGHAIEPVIAPLGFDWKIGVALIASFAAREVLVSTLSIIYNVGKDENEESETLISAVRDAKTDDGRPTWTPLTALTLMVFFVLAMQCMSTLAVVRRETNSWIWPIFMLVYMTGFAYIAALLTYQGGRLLGFG